MKKIISQSDNYAGNFGMVLRSSAIFYYRVDVDSEFKTTISFMNYWKFKRDMSVCILASVRSLSGDLVTRKELKFDQGEVINFELEDDVKSFEGSVEIEIFSIQNMVIPYAAIMAIYRSKSSISMVHSYTRTYSRHEIEEERTITSGRESCWTIRDNEVNRSFCVFHNGIMATKKQSILITITNIDGDIFVKKAGLKSLKPFETVVLYPSDYFKNIELLTTGKIANVSINFELSGAFTRLLVGNSSKDMTDFQVTHSNFNYKEYETDKLKSDSSTLMKILDDNFDSPKVIVYPDSSDGEYLLKNDINEFLFNSGDLLEFSPYSETIEISRTDGIIPKRIVTGFSANNALLLPFECSLGAMHCERPAKKMWWGSIFQSSNVKCKIFAAHYPEFYGAVDENSQINIRFYSSVSKNVVSKDINPKVFMKYQGVDVEEIFPDVKGFMGGKPGYFTFFSDYGGYVVYSMFTNNKGVSTIEHGF